MCSGPLYVCANIIAALILLVVPLARIMTGKGSGPFSGGLDLFDNKNDDDPPNDDEPASQPPSINQLTNQIFFVFWYILLMMVTIGVLLVVNQLMNLLTGMADNRSTKWQTDAVTRAAEAHQMLNISAQSDVARGKNSD